MEVLHYSRWSERDRQIEEAAKSGLTNVHQLLQLLAEHQDSKFLHPEGSAAASSAIANFKRVTMLLSRTGHARFRRGPRGHTSSLAGFEHAFIECPNTLHPSAASSSSNPAELAAAAAASINPAAAGLVSPQELAFLHQRHQNAALAAAIHRKVEAAAAQAQQRQRIQQQQQELALGKQLGHHHHHHVVDTNTNTNNTNNNTMNSMNSMSSRSFVSSLSIDPTVAMQGSGSPLSGRRKCMGKHEELGAKCATLKCHCSKRRKLRVKRTIKVPAISNKLADIPQDEYSWRKYGQKPIKGSPHPRGYYKCSSMRGCPARKHVERSLDDPSMLIVTYEGEHNHTRSNNPATTTTTTTTTNNNNNNNNNPGTAAPAGGAGGQAGGGGLVAHS